MKKHNAINYYHSVREAAAAGIIRVCKEDGETNAADLLTSKSLTGQKRWDICWHLMWCWPDETRNMREEVRNDFKLETRDEKCQGHEISRVDNGSMANYWV
jgi:hypothetical protein